MKNIKALAPIFGVLAIIILLFVWGLTSRNTASMTYIPGTNVACLPSGHQNLADHIHPIIAITVDGVQEVVPGNIGITSDCMAEIHTHDADGVIHVETVQSGRLADLTLSDFFAIWGTPLAREGFAHTLLIDGEEIADPASVHFRDGQQIGIVYRSLAE